MGTGRGEKGKVGKVGWQARVKGKLGKLQSHRICSFLRGVEVEAWAHCRSLIGWARSGLGYELSLPGIVPPFRLPRRISGVLGRLWMFHPGPPPSAPSNAVCLPRVLGCVAKSADLHSRKRLKRLKPI